MIDLLQLKGISEARWAAPLMELLLARSGARFAEMTALLSISKDSLSRTLDHLIEQRWIVRNSGRGHPLRPEYLLTEDGIGVAVACANMMTTRRRLGIAPETLPRWSLPVLVRLDGDWLGFAALRRDLSPVTSRALSLNLKQMIDGRLVLRKVEDSFPPSSLYGLASAGSDLLASLRAA